MKLQQQLMLLIDFLHQAQSLPIGCEKLQGPTSRLLNLFSDFVDSTREVSQCSSIPN